MKKFLFSALCAFFSLGLSAQVINIETEEISMILSANSSGEVLFHHFGSRISSPELFLEKATYRRVDHCTDMLAYGTTGGRNFRSPALRVTHSDGDLNTELHYVSHSQEALGDGVTQTRVNLKDSKTGLSVVLVYNAYLKENVITAHSEISNGTPGRIVLHEVYAPSLSLRSSKTLLTHFYGSWAREMQMDNTVLTHGIKAIESRKGVRTTHTENPSFLLSLGTESFSENYGEVIAGALAWSGNFRINFELDEFDILTVMGGANPYASEYPLEKGERFVTPEMIYTYSSEGAGGASRNFHDWARNHRLYTGTKSCPTLLNSWEGAYFDFDTETLTKMVDDAASLGLEMFVLDDGWFGNKYPRNNTKAGLGDWQVNKKKLPKGIDHIASYAHSKGLKFGIWIEPEMVNPNSELAKKHPEWVVKAPQREASTIRNQWLLDLSNPDVQDFVFKTFDNTLGLSENIDYIKWDANRHVESVGSSWLPADEQSRFWIDYTNGFYNVLERIRAKYPEIMIQACASGGGRVEYGALKYFDEVWTSDNTEALSRVYIQYGTNLIYPAVVTGSHVSAVPNHQTNNITPLKFRLDIAASGRMGFELQPADMTDEEKALARRSIESYKMFRDLINEGDLYRIASPYDGEGFYSLMYVSKDKKRAVVFGYCIKYQSRTLVPKFRLRGLDPEKNYLLKELNVDKSDFWGDGKTFSGSMLIGEGINPHLARIYDSGIYYLEAQE